MNKNDFFIENISLINNSRPQINDKKNERTNEQPDTSNYQYKTI